MSPEALAQHSGSSLERIEWFVELGVLSPGTGGFRPSDVQRVRVTEALDAAGIIPEDLSRLIKDGLFSFAAADALFPNPVPLIDTSLSQVSSDLGIPISLATRALIAWAVPAPAPDEPLRADDRSLLEIVAEVYEILGQDEERTIAGMRYFGDNLRRIAESQMRWFRGQVVNPAVAEGSTQAELTPMITEMAGRLLPLARTVLELGYRRHIEHYSVEITVENVESATDRQGLGRSPLRDPTVIAFIDLTGFTSLTEEEGDLAAARMAERLVETVRGQASAAGGSAVKFMGDGAMLRFSDPDAAVRCLLHLVDRMPELGLPQAHAGVNAGRVVFSDGDYFGRAVNLAARIADRAGPNQVLVADGVLDPVPEDLRLIPLGPVVMKGVSEPVMLHQAVYRTTDA